MTRGSILQCHHQQDPRLVNESGREEAYLTNAAIQGELSSMEPEDHQGLRDSAHGEDKVCSRQHAEEEVQGSCRLRLVRIMKMNSLFPSKAAA